MAPGKVHNATSAVLALPLGIAVAALRDPIEGVGAALGCLSGILLTPDLDQVAISISEWGMVKKLGPLGFLWMAWWYFYARAIPHRSPLSHWPILGTALRLVYCAIPLIIIWIILGRPALPTMPAWGWIFLRGWLTGLTASDTGHWALDSPLTKKRRKRK